MSQSPRKLPTRIKRRTDLERAVAHLVDADADLSRALALAGPVSYNMRPAGFPSLLKIVVEQQLSTASARAIWGRLAERIAPLHPETVLQASDRTLREVGLSAPKIRYCRALSRSVVEGHLDLQRLARLPDASAMAALQEVTGIGRWTAEIYLLFCLGRPDVWPAGDVAVQSALQTAADLPMRPDAQAMDHYADRCRPLRGVAALILWTLYRHLKGRPAWT